MNKEVRLISYLFLYIHDYAEVSCFSLELETDYVTL